MTEKTMRISKNPEERKQEIIDTAMQMFYEKGYEKTTIRDIAKAINVVPGLCYRYFSSKQEMYDCIVSQYVSNLCNPLIKILKDAENIDVLLKNSSQLLVIREGKEKYHDFFHKKGNENFHKLLNMNVCEYMLPYVQEFCEKMNNKGLTDIKDTKSYSQFMLYGQIGIISDNETSPDQKAEIIKKIIMLSL